MPEGLFGEFIKSNRFLFLILLILFSNCSAVGNQLELLVVWIQWTLFLAITAWGKYETQISVQQISESMLELLVQEGYIKLDKDDNLVKVNDEMVDDSSPVTKNS